MWLLLLSLEIPVCILSATKSRDLVWRFWYKFASINILREACMYLRVLGLQYKLDESKQCMMSWIIPLESVKLDEYLIWTTVHFSVCEIALPTSGFEAHNFFLSSLLHPKLFIIVDVNFEMLRKLEYYFEFFWIHKIICFVILQCLLELHIIVDVENSDCWLSECVQVVLSMIQHCKI